MKESPVSATILWIIAAILVIVGIVHYCKVRSSSASSC